MKSSPDIGFSRLLSRLAFFAAFWWLLNGEDARSWVVGGPAVIAATVASLCLRPEQSWRWRLAGVLPMAWFFLHNSVRGGFDVAGRAMRPGLWLNPGVIRFRTRLPPGSPRLFFVGLISLLPGTLVFGLEEDEVQIHALAAGPAVEDEVRALEEHVAALFGVGWHTAGEAKP